MDLVSICTGGIGSELNRWFHSGKILAGTSQKDIKYNEVRGIIVKRKTEGNLKLLNRENLKNLKAFYSE